MNGVSLRSDPAISTGIVRSISLQELVAGLKLSSSRVGPKIGLYGPAARRARGFPSRAKAAGLTTSDTFGPLSTTSLAPARPPSCSESKSPPPLPSGLSDREVSECRRNASNNLSAALGRQLRKNLAGSGSKLYKSTWSEQVTPAGRRYSLLRASALRTADIGCTGWPTPAARDGKDSPGMAIEGTNPDGTTRIRLDQLPRQAQLTAWTEAEGQGADRLPGAGSLAAWPTPTKGNADGGQSSESHSTTGRRADGTKATVSLNQVARSTAWTEAEGPARLTSTGEMLIGSAAGMAAGGQLKPEFSAWLMGYPHAWDRCAPISESKRRKS